MAAFESVFTQSGSDFFEIIPRVADSLSGFAEAKSGNTKAISSYVEVHSLFALILNIAGADVRDRDVDYLSGDILSVVVDQSLSFLSA